MRPPPAPARPARRPLPAYPANPLAPLGEQLLQRQVRGDVLPILRAASAEINRRALAGGQNIQGIANQLSHAIPGSVVKTTFFRNRASVEVDVGPRDPGQLTRAQPEHEPGDVERFEPVALSGLE